MARRRSFNRKEPLNHTRPEYRAWINMRSRCGNPNTPGFVRYGGRGVAVCAEWQESFQAFFDCVGERPSTAHSLDRIDNDGDYEPGNVRWATQSQQARNFCRNHIVQVGGKSMTLAEAVEQAPVPYNTVLYRLKRGWSLEQALTRTAHKGARP